MKKLLLLLMLSVPFFIACSKSNDNSSSTSVSIPASQVPSAVMTSFTTKYPGASGQIEWEREDGNTYKVKFFIGVQRWQAAFKADGTFISEQQI